MQIKDVAQEHVDPWIELKNGSKSGLIKIYRKFYSELYNYGFRICRDEEVTRDCIQDLFVKLWAGATKILDAKEPKPYMFKVLRFMIIDAINENKKTINKSELYLSDLTFSCEDVMIAKEISVENSILLKKAIGNLSNRQKEVIYLRFYSGLSYEEIAQITSIKYQSIRNLFSSALKELRKVLN